MGKHINVACSKFVMVCYKISMITLLDEGKHWLKKHCHNKF